MTEPRQVKKQKGHELFVFVLVDDLRQRLNESLHPNPQISRLGASIQKGLPRELFVEVLCLALYTDATLVQASSTHLPAS